MSRLNRRELKAIEDMLTRGGVGLTSEEVQESIDILATLRHRLSCDNHTLHRLRAVQLGMWKGYR